jgi:two-component system, response regulator YesN
LYELLSENYLCKTADTAEQAFAWLQAEPIDVVLTDISMPNVSGLELLQHVLEKYPRTLVIIISGLSDQEHAQNLIKLGAFDCLVKPFRLEVVEESVRRALAYSRKSDNVDSSSVD